MPDRTEKVGTTFVPIGLPAAILKHTISRVLGSRRKTKWEVRLSDVKVTETQDGQKHWG